MADILIVEDNKEIAELLRDFLQADGYSVSVASDGEKGLKLYKQYGAKLILLDIMLPGMDGYAVCSEIRKDSNTPIFMLSAKNEKNDKLNGLLQGADDYIEKPYDIDLLLAQIKGLFARRYGQDSITDGDLVINKAENKAYKGGVPLDLTIKEFELLLLLAENKGKALNKDFIFNRIWGFDSVSEPQTLTVHIKRLRLKIEDDPKDPKKIMTVWGVGYKYQ